jgi:hypothetical protein
VTDLTRDLTMVPTEHLLPGYEHVQFPLSQRRLYERMVRTGEIIPQGSIQRVGSIYYTTISRPPQHRAARPRWVRPAAGLGLILGGAAGFVALVVWAVRSIVEAVASSLPGIPTLLGFLVAVSLLLLLGTAATRRRTFEGTFKGTIR